MLDVHHEKNGRGSASHTHAVMHVGDAEHKREHEQEEQRERRYEREAERDDEQAGEQDEEADDDEQRDDDREIQSRCHDLVRSSTAQQGPRIVRKQESARFVLDSPMVS